MPFKCLDRKLFIKGILLVMLFTGLVMSFSCKKAIAQEKQKIANSVITTGRWYVELYKNDNTDVTGEFLGYEFQFYDNGNVDGIKNTVIKTGTWSMDIPSYTIVAAFPPAAGDTLNRLSYTWKINDSALDYVAATTTTSSGSDTLHLRKKQ